MQLIAGIDEVGRGAVAGPVVAGACIVSVELFRRKRAFPCWSPYKEKVKPDVLIADSKLLSPEQREAAYEWIIAHCATGTGREEADAIDRQGILHATQNAMLGALEELCQKTVPEKLLIDGRDNFRFPIEHVSIIRGDQTEPAIAAASIVAKVTRDRWMREHAHLEFPLYGFAQHKGYGSAGHLAAIKERGVCPFHRKTFLSAVLAA